MGVRVALQTGPICVKQRIGGVMVLSLNLLLHKVVEPLELQSLSATRLAEVMLPKKDKQGLNPEGLLILMMFQMTKRMEEPSVNLTTTSAA
jgi:hypothetical protein